ncbi:uncharacterized protein PgNI_08222 [Pyricularia grisea]|uniref:Uncharacterized protein n=1 Tax=Pyricularia grisea TaxID=148305 RepID=A0A6P8AWI9_PYRGI|nr:uncharacterized protein PgNI_08222 [Pyricularia grisea]TLD06552.1 hypothetical protein PgNI_08222 [Pyricularia grisea]
MQAEVLEPPEILTYQTREQPSSCLQPRCAACSNSNVFGRSLRLTMISSTGGIWASIRIVFDRSDWKKLCANFGHQKLHKRVIRSYRSVRSSGFSPCAFEGREREENQPSNGTCNIPHGYD